MDWSAECETVQNNAPRAENETLMQMDSGHARPAERLAVVAPGFSPADLEGIAQERKMPRFGLWVLRAATGKKMSG